MAANRSAFGAQQYADGTLRNAQVIESMGMQRDIHRRWMDKQREFLELQALASDRAGGYQAMTKFLQTTMSSALLGLGAWLLLHDSLNGGGGDDDRRLHPRRRACWRPLVQVVTQWRTVVAVRDSWDRLDQLLAIRAQGAQGHAAAARPRGSGGREPGRRGPGQQRCRSCGA